MKKIKVTVNEEDWETSEYRTKEWEDKVDIKSWTHDYVLKVYIIEYLEK